MAGEGLGPALVKRGVLAPFFVPLTIKFMLECQNHP